MKEILNIEQTHQYKFYEIFELFKDLDNETVDLFARAEFDIEDVDDLKVLKLNAIELNNLIEKKISDIYVNVIKIGFENE